MENPAPSPAAPEVKTNTPPKEALSPQKMEELRQKQQQKLVEGLGIEARLKMGGMSAQLERERKEHFHEEMVPYLNKEYLLDNGISEDDPNFDKYMELLREGSINVFSRYGDTWHVNPAVDSDGNSLPSQKETYTEAWETKFGPETDPNEEKIDELSRDVSQCAQKKYAAFARRMRSSVFNRKQKKELDEAYQAAETDYLDKLKELRLLHMEEQRKSLRAAHIPEEEINEAINRELEYNFSIRLKFDDESQRKVMLAEGGFWARKLERFANMSTKKKVIFGLGATALGAGLGLGGALLVGATGGAAAMLIGGGLASFRGGRTYATTYSRLYANKQQPEKLRFKVDENLNPEDALELALARLKDESRQEIKSGDKAKRRAVMFAVGSVALGAWGGDVLAWIKDHLTMDSPIKLNGIKAPVQPHPDRAEPDLAPEPTTPQTPPPLQPEHPTEARIIHTDEGLYSTFDQLQSIPKSDYGELLQRVGPQLAELDNGSGRPFAYEIRGEAGNWGIRMTPDGVFPEEALEVIRQTQEEITAEHAADGGSTITPIDVIQPNDVAASSLLETASEIKPGTGGEQFARNLGLTPQAWYDNLQPFIADQLTENKSEYTKFFYEQGDKVYLKAGHISDKTMADLVNHLKTTGVRVPA